MPQEVELKLEATVDAMAAIEASGLLPGAPVTASQKSTYFDTPDHQLAAAGLSLRIRQVGGRRIQTVKARGGSTAGLFARSEWERAVEDDRPVLDETTPIRAVIGELASRIEPLFDVRIERRTWIVREGMAAIELVLDRGEAVAGDRSAPISEIELELKDGDPVALFALAGRLAAAAPVTLGVLSKSERGYRLLEEATTAIKAPPVALRDDMTAADAFQHIVQACLRQFRLNEALILHGRHAGALHQARVALRRLRSAFSIFAVMVQDDRAGHLRAALRDLAAELGEARNLDVLLAATGPGPARDRIAEARKRTYDRVEAVLTSPATRTLMLDLLRWTITGDWLDDAAGHATRHMPARAFAADALDRFRRKVKKKGRGIAEADDEMRHEVRKDAKKLRYASDFFRSLFERKTEKRRHRKFVSALQTLQDRLGELNDLATAPAVFAALGLDPQQDATRDPSDRKARLIEAAAEAREDLVDQKRFWR